MVHINFLKEFFWPEGISPPQSALIVDVYTIQSGCILYIVEPGHQFRNFYRDVSHEINGKIISCLIKKFNPNWSNKALRLELLVEVTRLSERRGESGK